MGLTTLSDKIQKYCEEADSLERKSHAERLESIGKEFKKTSPSKITPDDLSNLEDALVDLKNTINPKATEIKAINDVITIASWLVPQQPNQRTKEMITDLVNIGDQLLKLSILLSKAIVPVLIQSIIDQMMSN